MMPNFGVWGLGPKGGRAKFVELKHDLERKVWSFGGRGEKCLYAHVYYTEEEFKDIYDPKTYNALREKYATYLPGTYTS